MAPIDATLILELNQAWEDYKYIYSTVYNVIEELGWTIHESRVRIKIHQLRDNDDENNGSKQAPTPTTEKQTETVQRAEETMAEIRDNIVWVAGEARRLKHEGRSPNTLLSWSAKTETLMEYLWSARNRGVAAIADLETRVLGMRSEEVPCSLVREKRGRWTRVDLSAGRR